MGPFFFRRPASACLAAWLALASLSAAAQPAADPALNDLIRQTLAQNPAVRAARAAVDAAEARLRGAGRPLYNPALELDAEQAETRAGSIGLSQTLDWTDKRGARSDVADAELAAARAQYAALSQQLVGELLAGLGTWQTALAVHRLAQERLTLMQRFFDLADKRRRAGDLNQVELDLASLAQTRARLQLSQAAADRIEAQQALAALSGNLSSDWPALPQDIPPLQAFEADTLLQRLPQLQALRAGVDAARAAVELRRRERRPDPTIGVRAGQEQAFRNGNDDRFNLAGVTLSIPLYLRNNFRAEVDVAAAELTQAQESLQDNYRRARARLLSAADRYRLSRGAWEVWQGSGQASLGSQIDLLERIWRAGEMSTADYLLQLNQTLDTRANALDVQRRLWQAWADWLVASGQVAAWLDPAVSP